MRIPKAYFIDIDGTLAGGHNANKINNIDEKAMKAAARDGAYIIISTGRNPERTFPFWEQVDIGKDETSYFVSNNGSVIMDARNNVVLRKDNIDKMTFSLITQTLYGRGHLVRNVKSDGFYGKKTIRNRITSLFTKVSYSLDDYKFDEVASRKIGCVSFYSKRKVRKLKKELEILFPEVEISVSGPGLYLEITKNGVNKGGAIEFMSDHLGIDIEDTVHIGDSMNDYSAFKVAGTSVAMANGMKQVKKAADFVTKPMKKQGVSKAIDSLRKKRVK